MGNHCCMPSDLDDDYNDPKKNTNQKDEENYNGRSSVKQKLLMNKEDIWKELCCLYESKSPDYAKDLNIKFETKNWILNNIVSTHTFKKSLVHKKKDVIKWVKENNDPIVVAVGESPLSFDSSLVQALFFQETSPSSSSYYLPFIFFYNCVSNHGISSFQIRNALQFLACTSTLIVLNEFQHGGFASNVKFIQDYKLLENVPFQMLLYGSDKEKSFETAIKVFYSVHDVNNTVYSTSIPSHWCKPCNDIFLDEYE